MSEPITVRLVTPAKMLFEKPASEVILTGEKGLFAVLPKRAPLVAALVPSKLTIKHGNSEEYYFITSGMVEVSDDSCNILVEAAVAPDQVPVDEFKARLASLKDILKDQPKGLIYDELADHIAFIEMALANAK